LKLNSTSNWSYCFTATYAMLHLYSYNHVLDFCKRIAQPGNFS